MLEDNGDIKETICMWALPLCMSILLTVSHLSTQAAREYLSSHWDWKARRMPRSAAAGQKGSVLQSLPAAAALGTSSAYTK